MKKIIICFLLIAIFICIVIAWRINYGKFKFKLIITESSWSGWSPEYKPDEVTKEYDVVLGKEYSIDSGNLIFSIEKINKDHIIIKTSEPFSDKEDGIDLKTKKTTFKIYLDSEIELTTPTMDAGEIYYIKLVK